MLAYGHIYSLKGYIIKEEKLKTSFLSFHIKKPEKDNKLNAK